MDEKALMEFLCSVKGFEKEIVQKILDSNAPCKRCLVIPGPGKCLSKLFKMKPMQCSTPLITKITLNLNLKT